MSEKVFELIESMGEIAKVNGLDEISKIQYCKTAAQAKTIV